MEMELPEDKKSAVVEAIFGGRKIEAIKLFREATGCDLAAAKQAVETLAAELYAKEPSKFATPPAKAGCLGAVVVLLLLGFGVWALFKTLT